MGVASYGQRTIAVGRVRPLPPPAALDSTDGCTDNADVLSLDWEGEIKCGMDVSFGTFDFGILHMQVGTWCELEDQCIDLQVLQDYIMISVGPAYPARSAFVTTRTAIAIRLVTDSWSDAHNSYDHLGLV
jgi:hypothetical protein